MKKLLIISNTIVLLVFTPIHAIITIKNNTACRILIATGIRKFYVKKAAIQAHEPARESYGRTTPESPRPMFYRFLIVDELSSYDEIFYTHKGICSISPDCTWTTDIMEIENDTTFFVATLPERGITYKTVVLPGQRKITIADGETTPTIPHKSVILADARTSYSEQPVTIIDTKNTTEISIASLQDGGRYEFCLVAKRVTLRPLLQS